MTWRCGALENQVTFFPDGTISPCCLIHSNYKKPVTELFNDPFADIRNGEPPAACEICHDNERNNHESLRQGFKLHNDTKYRYLDIRNFNSCNMKCRICGPMLSSLWGQELGYENYLQKQDISPYLEQLINEDLKQVYYTGGEPMLNPDHWKLLDLIIERKLNKNIRLQYNTNGTIIKYKDKDIINIWKHFREVHLMVSVDATGEEFNILRHGGIWEEVKQNLLTMKTWPVKLEVAVTVNLLNIWFLKNIFEELKGFEINLYELNNPSFLSLSAIDERYKQQALDCLDECSEYIKKNDLDFYKSRLRNNFNCDQFKNLITHVLLLDKKRNENLFDKLPFNDYTAINL